MKTAAPTPTLFGSYCGFFQEPLSRSLTTSPASSPVMPTWRFSKTSPTPPRSATSCPNVSSGAPVPGNQGRASPWIFCVTGPGQVVDGMDENPGQDYYSGALSTGLPAGPYVSADTDAPFVFLYPRFWTYPSVLSASPSTCLTVLPHFNRYKQDREKFVSYQLWILLHELVHQYT